MTKTYGVIGNPIQQSKSPAMHNAAFKALGIDAIYKKFELQESELASFFDKIRKQEISGISITIPYKQKAFEFVDDVSSFAKKCGAINTVYFKDDKLIGDNTDGRGYLKSLLQETKFNIKDKNILLYGAGGASRAILYSLLEQNPQSISIANRTLAKAQNLCHYYKAHPAATNLSLTSLSDKKVLANTDLFINTTSLGLLNKPWPDLSFVKNFKPGTLVSDIVYNPKETELLLAAQQNNLAVHYGLGMLVQQGAIAFELFTGKSPNVDLMFEAIT
ncbi:shikimate dehydrogenase [bacterium K02(2017)]|nr:shikimate dehydrogenase [bacterium K02(2017)]